ncbi:MAG: hypothetical protein HY553_09175 [Elusimicrobia bacterium]|nr:hypothetical protein [Elusimicrobiota bacterium]
MPNRDASRETTALVFAAVVAGFCFRLAAFGFYNDDYPWLEIWSSAPGSTPWAIARHWAESHAGQWFRPGTLILHPVQFSLFGLNPLPYQLVLLAIHLGLAIAFQRLLENEGVDPRTAAFAAIAAALYPNHDATRHWPSLAGGPFALALTLASLVAYRRWQRESGAALLAGSLGAFAYGTLHYEGAALLPALVVYLRWRERPAAWPAVRDALPLLGTLALVVLYQRVLVPAMLVPERHPMSVSVGHAFKVLAAGFECTIANRLLHFIARSAAHARALFGVFDWLLCAAAAAALARLTLRWAKGERPASPPRLLPLAGLGFFLLGYAPYFLDSSYTPVVFAQVNRVNMVASLGGACWLAWLFERRPWGSRACAAILAAFLLATWSSNAQWAEAYRLQQSALERLRPKVPPGQKTILLFGLPDDIGSATVFQSTYDFDAAMRLAWKDPGARGRVGTGRVRFERDAAVHAWYGETLLAYSDLYAYDYASDRFERLEDKAAGERFLASLH